MARVSVEVMVLLFGTLTLWLGFLRSAAGAGMVEKLARLLGPLFARLMPGVPRNHPAIGLITLNFAANGLGLDNAATPIGLRAMRELQSLNPTPETASNAQILFLVLNASSAANRARSAGHRAAARAATAATSRRTVRGPNRGTADRGGPRRPAQALARHRRGPA
ncbi:hypothetical protein G6F40_015597 [Rhizopus arrhizus]|nr:hypothetical protein G6F40_015597 [Rhizopus arrhizus]